MLSVLTLNLWHDSGPYERRAGLIREWVDRLDPDLIGFQEALRGPDADQTTELLDGRGYHVEYKGSVPFWKEESRWRGGEFGNAVASRWPIAEREEASLSDAGEGEKCTAISVTVESPFGEVGFTCSHLHWKFRDGTTRETQVRELCDFALRRRPKSGFPPILVGDFNAEPESAEIRYVKGLQSFEGHSIAMLDAWAVAGDGGPGHTWVNRNPYARDVLEYDRRIDYILTGFPILNGVGKLEACRVVCNEPQDSVWPTDHLGVYAELRTDPIPGLEEKWGLAGGDDVTVR